MKISKQAQRDARQLFRNCLVDGWLDEARVRQVIALLSEKKPRGYVEILARLHRLVKLEVKRRSAKVESATPLPGDVQEQVAGEIKRKYGAGVAISFSQNPALLGGLRIQVGSDLYDGSVQTKLNRLAQSF